MANSAIDGNRNKTILGVNSIDLLTPTKIAVNPITGAMLIDGTSLYTKYLKLDASNNPITGDLKLVPTVNSTTTFQVFKQDGTTNVLDVDTTNGRVGIGTVAPLTHLQLSKPSVNNSGTVGSANFEIFATDDATNNQNKGGSINFSGIYQSTAGGGILTQAYGFIAGRKENTTDNNSRGFLSLGSMGVEIMRLSSSGEVGFFGAGPTSGRYNFSLAMIGTAARSIGMERHTTAGTAGNDLQVQAGGGASGATDIAGGAIVIKPGFTTGMGRSLVKIEALPVQLSTATSDNSGYFDAAIYGCYKALTNNSAIAIVNATDASNTAVAGTINYAVEVFNGTDLQVEVGVVSYMCTNKGGVFSGNACVKSINQQNMTSGTLAVTFAITGANPAVISVNANSSLTPSTGYPRLRYVINNLVGQVIAIQ